MSQTRQTPTKLGPLVTIVIPAYNAAATIVRTMESALAQTHGNLEVIVVDDGSRDNTFGLASLVAQKDARVTVVQQANAGVSAARNRGIGLSTGAFIAPLDADDLWLPDKIETQLDVFREKPESGAVYCWFAVIDERDRVQYPRKIYHTPSGAIYADLVVANCIGNASSPLIRRHILLEAGCYDETFKEGCEDLDLYIRIAEISAYGLVPRFLVGYRRSDSSMSMNIGKMERAVALLTAKIVSRKPAIPKRLLRWRNGNMARYLGFQALIARDYRMAAKHLSRAILNDPLIGLHWMTNVLGRLSPRRSDVALAGSTVDFYESSPRQTSLEAPVDGWFERVRRHGLQGLAHIDARPVRDA